MGTPKTPDALQAATADAAARIREKLDALAGALPDAAVTLRAAALTELEKVAGRFERLATRAVAKKKG